MMLRSDLDRLEPTDYCISQSMEQPMTYILGAKCSDGVVLVSDTLVANLKTGIIISQGKLYGEYYPIVIGASGNTGLTQSFKNEAFKAAQMEGKPVNTSEEVFVYSSNKEAVAYLDYLKKLQQVIDGMNTIEINALVSAQTQDKGATLHLIQPKGEPTEVDYYAIGIGSHYGAIFLKKCWNKKWTMMQTAKLGAFIIKYIEDFKLNAAIGGLPQIWLIPNQGEVMQIELDLADKGIENKLKEHESHLTHLFD